MRVALVTANFGGIDPVLELPDGWRRSPVEPVYFTDDPALRSSTWDVRLRPRATNPRLTAKYYKCQVSHVVDRGASHIAWFDSCIRLRSVAFLEGWADRAGKDGAIVVQHPDRATVADEYAYVIRQVLNGYPYLSSRYSASVLADERDHLLSLGYDLGRLPLYAGGAWLLSNGPAAWRFLDAWWSYVCRFSIFDQCAMGAALEESGLRVVSVPTNLYRNADWERVPHA